MFLSEWREFPSAPCLVGGKKTWWQLASRCCWNRARPWHASELVSFLVVRRSYQHPGNNKTPLVVIDAFFCMAVVIITKVWTDLRSFNSSLAALSTIWRRTNTLARTCLKQKKKRWSTGGTGFERWGHTCLNSYSDSVCTLNELHR